jgi:hypothetical protein
MKLNDHQREILSKISQSDKVVISIPSDRTFIASGDLVQRVDGELTAVVTAITGPDSFDCVILASDSEDHKLRPGYVLHNQNSYDYRLSTSRFDQESIRYKYRGLPCTDKEYSVCGTSEGTGAGVLEWCTSYEDAIERKIVMELFPQFSNLSIYYLDRNLESYHGKWVHFVEKFVSKLKCTWGFDEDGDLTLKVGPLYFSLHRDNKPVISTQSEFKPLSRDNVNAVMRALKAEIYAESHSDYD